MSLFDPRRGHILGLSDELLVHVLSLLTASDLISVSRTRTKLSSLARDKHVIRRLDFRRDTRLTAENLKHFLGLPAAKNPSGHPVENKNMHGIVSLCIYVRNCKHLTDHLGQDTLSNGVLHIQIKPYCIYVSSSRVFNLPDVYIFTLYVCVVAQEI